MRLPLVPLFLVASIASGQQYRLKFLEEGVSQGFAGIINCSGTGVTCTVSGNTATIDVTSTGGGGDGGGIPSNVPVITYAASADLTAERILAGGPNITVGLDGGSMYVSVTGTVPSATTATTATSATTATTATQLASDPTACGAGNYVTDISASGVLTCSVPPGTYTLPDSTNLVTGGIRLTGDLSGTATSPSVVDDSHAHTASTISGLDVGDITTGTLPQARGGTGAAALTCSSGQALTSNGTAYSCTSTLTASDVVCSGTCVGVAELSATGTPSATTYLRGDGTWSTPSSSSGYATVADEGSGLTQRTTINFTGAGVSCADNAGSSRTDCTISGGSGPTIQTARTTGTHTIGSTTATEITALQISLAGAGAYKAEYHLRTRSSSTTNGYKYGINVTANLTSLACVAMHPTTGSTATTGVGDGVQATLTGGIMEVLGATNTASTTAANLGPNTGVASTTETIPVLIECSIITSGAGDLEVWMGSEAAVNVTNEAGSFAIVTTIP